MKKNDWLLGGGIILAAVIVLCFQLFRSTDGEKSVTVTVDGEMYGTYTLSENLTVDINGTNRLVIENGTAVMEWADCPDQVCVNHNAVSREGESIICLPNGVVIAVQGLEEPETDAVVQ